MGSLFIMQGYVIMGSAFIIIPVQEKEEKIIRLLRTRGLSTLSYWTGHFSFDFLYFLLNFLVLRIWFSDTFSELPFSIMFFTGVSMILYSYCCSLIFEKKKTANSWFTIINSLFLYLLSPLMIPNSPVKDTTYGKIYFLRYFYPYFDLGSFLIGREKSVQDMNNLNNQMENFNSQMGNSPHSTEYEPTVIYSIFIFLAILAFFEGNVFVRIFKRRQEEEVS